MQMLIMSVSRLAKGSGSIGAILRNHYVLSGGKPLKKDIYNVMFFPNAAAERLRRPHLPGQGPDFMPGRTSAAAATRGALPSARNLTCCGGYR
jgi:hypothetical protein